VTVPSSWEPSVLEGSFWQGYARLDDMDSIRFELKWNRLKGSADADDMRDRLLRQLQRRSRRSRSLVEAAPVKRPGGSANASFFQWKDEVAALGLVTRHQNQKGERAILGQVIFPDGRVDRTEAMDVLNSVQERGSEKGSPWSLYRFHAQVGDSWTLESWKLSPGYLELAFGRRGGQALRLRRWGPAEVILADCDLEGWHRQLVATQYGRNVDVGLRRAAGHDAFEARREIRKSVFSQLVSRWAPPRAAWTHWNMESMAWRCPQSNRIYLWEYAWRRRCHRRDWHIHCHGDLV